MESSEFPAIKIEKVTNESAREFLLTFLHDRAVNMEFYRRVPNDRLDYRMINTTERKSDCPRESIAHQIYVTRKYIYGVKTGVLTFDGIVDKPVTHLVDMSKQELFDELEATESELINTLSDPQIESRKVQVPWSKNPIGALKALHGLQDHEILHTGWNLAVMDHLNIPRFPLLEETWG